MIEPLPKARSICDRAASSAFSCPQSSLPPHEEPVGSLSSSFSHGQAPIRNSGLPPVESAMYMLCSGAQVLFCSSSDIVIFPFGRSLGTPLELTSSQRAITKKNSVVPLTVEIRAEAYFNSEVDRKMRRMLIRQNRCTAVIIIYFVRTNVNLTPAGEKECLSYTIEKEIRGFSGASIGDLIPSSGQAALNFPLAFFLFFSPNYCYATLVASAPDYVN